MRIHAPPLPSIDDPVCSTLPFAGLGLELVEVRSKVSSLVCIAVPKRETVLVPAWDAPTPSLHGYGLLLRLSRETLGS